jgi:hypothetical protein
MKKGFYYDLSQEPRAKDDEILVRLQECLKLFGPDIRNLVLTLESTRVGRGVFVWFGSSSFWFCLEHTPEVIFRLVNRTLTLFLTLHPRSALQLLINQLVMTMISWIHVVNFGILMIIPTLLFVDSGEVDMQSCIHSHLAKLRGGMEKMREIRSPLCMITDPQQGFVQDAAPRRRQYTAQRRRDDQDDQI